MGSGVSPNDGRRGRAVALARALPSIALISALSAVLVACGIFGGSDDEDPTPTIVVQQMASPTTAASPTIAVASPQATPRPSGTAVATPSPRPLTPTASPSAGSSSAEARRYEATVEEYADRLETSARRVQTLMQNPQFTDAEWKSEVMTELDVWRQTHDDAQSLRPPTGYEAAHDRLMEGIGLFNDAADDVENGINNLSIASLLQAQAKIERAQTLYDEARALMPNPT